MTIPELIAAVLQAIRTKFYDGSEPRWDVRAYKRDEKALMRAISRYGYACNERNWQFKAEDIQRDLMALLRDIVKRQEEIKWLPIYLEHAVDKHIRVRAEELSAQAKANGSERGGIKNLARIVEKEVDGVKPVVVVERTDTEILATLYSDLKRTKKARQVSTVKPVKQQQQEMNL